MKNLITSAKKIGKIKTFGYSMIPVLHDGDGVIIKKIPFQKIQINDIICFKKKEHFITHRVLYKNLRFLIPKGDNNQLADGKIFPKSVLGIVTQVERRGQLLNIDDIYLLQSSIYFEEIRKVLRSFNKSGIKNVVLKGLTLHLFLEKKHPRRYMRTVTFLLKKKILNALINYY